MFLVLAGFLVVLPVVWWFGLVAAVARQSPTALVLASVLLPCLFQIECLLQAVWLLLFLVVPTSVPCSAQCLPWFRPGHSWLSRSGSK